MISLFSTLSPPNRTHHTPRMAQDSHQVKVVPQPPEVEVNLFLHQRANIYRMEEMERTKRVVLRRNAHLEEYIEGNVSVLGDPPGTGKTLTMLALISRDKMKSHDLISQSVTQKCSNINGSIRVMLKETYAAVQTTLIVTSLSIFHQWESELKRVQGLRDSYKMVMKKADCVDLDQYRVVICTVNVYNELANRYHDVVFKRFVYDEMDSAYIPNMAPVRARHYWFFSATFDEVLTTILRSRKVHFMKQLFANIISDGTYDKHTLLQAITVISPEKLRKVHPVPDKYEVVYHAVKKAPVLKFLGNQMDETVREMLESGNITGAIKHLGGKDSDQDIAQLLKKRAQRKLEEAEEKVEKYQREEKEELKREWTYRREEAERDLREITERIESIAEEPCSVCANSLSPIVLYPCCQNITCVACAAGWKQKNNTCPFCRHDNPDILIPRDECKVNENIPECALEGDKFGQLLRICSKAKKVLIFASHDNCFKPIVQALKDARVSCSTLMGHVSQRTKCLEAYTHGDTKVLILNSRENGAGLNLQVTTDIILWHLMPIPIVKQNIGRALRYGLEHTLTVHKFYTKEEETWQAEGEDEE